MDDSGLSWWALGIAVAIIAGYELWVWRRLRADPLRIARSAHSRMRAAWLAALSQQPGSEILAVQTLRNSLMSATIIGSTAALALMGSIPLAAAGLPLDGSQAVPVLTARLVLRLLLWGTLFASLVCSAMAMRSYNHAGYAASMPVGSPERTHYLGLAAAHLGRAGLLYSWSLRCLLFVAPVVAGLVNPIAAPFASLVLVAALISFDRVPAVEL